MSVLDVAFAILCGYLVVADVLLLEFDWEVRPALLWPFSLVRRP